MGYRKFALTRRKNGERKRLQNGIVKTIKGRPPKNQKYIRLKQSSPEKAVNSLTGIQSVITLPENWTLHCIGTPVTEIKVCKVGTQTISTGNVGCYITMMLVIESDCNWILSVHGRQITSSRCSAIRQFPQFILKDIVNIVLQSLDKLSVCPAHPDERFVLMAREKKSY